MEYIAMIRAAIGWIAEQIYGIFTMLWHPRAPIELGGAVPHGAELFDLHMQQGRGIILFAGLPEVGKTQIVNALRSKKDRAQGTSEKDMHSHIMSEKISTKKLVLVDIAGEHYKRLKDDSASDIRDNIISTLNTLQGFKKRMRGLVLVIDRNRPVKNDEPTQAEAASNLLLLLQWLYVNKPKLDPLKELGANISVIELATATVRRKRLKIPILVLFSKSDTLSYEANPLAFMQKDHNLSSLYDCLKQRCYFFHVDFCHAIKADFDTRVTLAHDPSGVSAIHWLLERKHWWDPSTRFWIKEPRE